MRIHIIIQTVQQSVELCRCFCCSFEQEVLGGPVPVSGSPPLMEAVPVALAVPAVPVVRPIIGTNTYRQVCALVVVSTQQYFIHTAHCRVMIAIKQMCSFSLFVQMQNVPQTQEGRCSSIVFPCSFFSCRSSKHQKPGLQVLLVLHLQPLQDQVNINFHMHSNKSLALICCTLY